MGKASQRWRKRYKTCQQGFNGVKLDSFKASTTKEPRKHRIEEELGKVRTLPYISGAQGRKLKVSTLAQPHRSKIRNEKDLCWALLLQNCSLVLLLRLYSLVSILLPFQLSLL